MTADDIIRAAKKRLAELDAERVQLLAMLAAVEGKPVAAPVPNPQPFIPVLPQPMPYLPQRDYPWEPLGPVICGTIKLSDDSILITSTNGVRSADMLVIGGPQRVDPSLRFAH